MMRSAIRELERRYDPLRRLDFELRATPAGAQQFVGHAAVFFDGSSDERKAATQAAIGNPLQWGFFERVMPGAFTKTIAEGDARFLVDHNSSMLCARVSSGDLRLAQDAVGLAVDSDMDTRLSYVSDLVVNLEARRITGMSMGFYVVRDRWETEEIELPGGAGIATAEVRIVDEIRLLEVSAVTFPAYEETDAALRALSGRVDPDPLHRRASLFAVNPGRPADATDPADAASAAPAPTGEPTELTRTRTDLDDALRMWAAVTGLPLELEPVDSPSE